MLKGETKLLYAFSDIGICINIEQVLICWVNFVLNMSGEFKVMYFTTSNSLHDFPIAKCIFFLKKSCEKIQVDLS